MKTLDEVIETAPYIGTEWTNDALHYLKHLQEYYEMSREHHEPNPPLTWDELKQMEGKPVWVEHEGYAPGWEVIEYTGNTKWKYGEVIETHLSILHKENQGKSWQAYKKERG